MRFAPGFAAILCGSALAGSAQAAQVCPAGLICASSPQDVANALRDAGYKAELIKDKTGDPEISSAASGYDYDLLFYGCDNGAECKSLSFAITFVKDAANTAELANMWNVKQRFSAMAVNDDGSLTLSYDLTTVGGVTPANFKEVLGWWEDNLAKANKFFKEHPATPAGKTG